MSESEIQVEPSLSPGPGVVHAHDPSRTAPADGVHFDPLAAPFGSARRPWYHFSIDDVLDCLIEVTDRGIPLFEHPFFAILREMNALHGVQVGLHLFYQTTRAGKKRTLAEVRDLRTELAAAGGWLRFGPHALDTHTSPFTQPPRTQMHVFDQIYSEIDRFAGAGVNARWIRLHHYSESFELADYFRKRGVTALFTTDRPVGSHRMPQEIKTRLYEKGSATYLAANFIRTQFRVEFFADGRVDGTGIERLFRDALAQYRYVVLYSHEYEFVRPDVRQALRDSFDALQRLSTSSVLNV